MAFHWSFTYGRCVMPTSRAASSKSFKKWSQSSSSSFLHHVFEGEARLELSCGIYLSRRGRVLRLCIQSTRIVHLNIRAIAKSRLQLHGRVHPIRFSASKR